MTTAKLARLMSEARMPLEAIDVVRDWLEAHEYHAGAEALSGEIYMPAVRGAVFVVADDSYAAGFAAGELEVTRSDTYEDGYEAGFADGYDEGVAAAPEAA